MSRPRMHRLTVYVTPTELRDAAEALGLRRAGDIVLAGALTAIEHGDGRRPEIAVFIPAYHLDSIGALDVIRLLRTGFSVALAHRGRLRTYKPDTLRACRLERKLLKALPPLVLAAIRRIGDAPQSYITAKLEQALSEYDGPVVGGDPDGLLPLIRDELRQLRAQLPNGD